MTPLLALYVAQNVFFAIIAVVAVVAALKLVTTTNVVHAALYLVVVLSAVAATYILLAAEFVASTQVMVYIGAVMVLLLFGVMLTRAQIGRDSELDHERRWVSALIALLLFVVMAGSVLDYFGDEELLLEGGVQRTDQVADSIFSTYIIPFEGISILLLAALIGAIVVARRD